MYFRLINETDTYIMISETGLEIPNAECVQCKSKTIGSSTKQHHYVIIFEDGREVNIEPDTINPGSPHDPHSYIMKKLPCEDSVEANHVETHTRHH